MTYLITGATGDIGSRVVENLLRRGDRPRVFVRDASKARSRFGDRVAVFVGDLADPTALRAALEGVDEFFLLNSGPQIPVRDEMAAHSAKTLGVRHLVKLSSMDVEQGLAIGAWHERGEAAIRKTGISFTFGSRQASCRICLPGRHPSRPKAWFAHPQATGGERSFTR